MRADAASARAWRAMSHCAHRALIRRADAAAIGNGHQLNAREQSRLPRQAQAPARKARDRASLTASTTRLASARSY